uniref:Uncharacterized protein n=1 Tax=viral metagenome TaxID=1070528 RepID=A0A6C0DFI5_9ZZZZ
MFKNFSSSSSSRTSQHQKRQPVIVNFNQDDFPDLVNHTTPLMEKEEPKKSLDYKGASLINHDNNDDKEKKQPGWTYLTMDKNRTIQIENYKIQQKYINKDSKDTTWRTILGQMITSWEKYKENYIELYGEDCYNHMYEMPRDDYKYYEDGDEYNNDEMSSADEQDYYDDIIDDYDNYL